MQALQKPPQGLFYRGVDRPLSGTIQNADRFMLADVSHGTARYYGVPDAAGAMAGRYTGGDRADTNSFVTGGTFALSGRNLSLSSDREHGIL